MTLKNLINIFGLFCDILGSIILYFYGLAPKISPEGHINLILDQLDEEEIQKAEKYKKRSSFGISIIALGFVLQLISTFIN